MIIEAFGVGGLPSYGDDKLLDIVINAISRGKIIIMTTQVQNEGSDLAVYNVGHRLKGWRNVLEAYDMTTESALAKIMYPRPDARFRRDTPCVLRAGGARYTLSLRRVEMNNVVIIGGGASGMAAAITASEDKNNNVILLETAARRQKAPEHRQRKMQPHQYRRFFPGIITAHSPAFPMRC